MRREGAGEMHEVGGQRAVLLPPAVLDRPPGGVRVFSPRCTGATLRRHPRPSAHAQAVHGRQCLARTCERLAQRAGGIASRAPPSWQRCAQTAQSRAAVPRRRAVSACRARALPPPPIRAPPPPTAREDRASMAISPRPDGPGVRPDLSWSLEPAATGACRRTEQSTKVLPLARCAGSAPTRARGPGACTRDTLTAAQTHLDGKGALLLLRHGGMRRGN